MACPPVKRLVDAVENDDFPTDLVDHVESCDACSDILRTLRDESESLTISVGSLWVKERISCPHPDILLAHLSGDLSAEEADYIEFHLSVVDCPRCQSEATRLQDILDHSPPERLEQAFDEAMRRSTAFLDQFRE